MSKPKVFWPLPDKLFVAVFPSTPYLCLRASKGSLHYKSPHRQSSPAGNCWVGRQFPARSSFQRFLLRSFAKFLPWGPPDQRRLKNSWVTGRANTLQQTTPLTSTPETESATGIQPSRWNPSFRARLTTSTMSWFPLTVPHCWTRSSSWPYVLIILFRFINERNTRGRQLTVQLSRGPTSLPLSSGPVRVVQTNGAGPYVPYSWGAGQM